MNLTTNRIAKSWLQWTIAIWIYKSNGFNKNLLNDFNKFEYNQCKKKFNHGHFLHLYEAKISTIFLFFLQIRLFYFLLSISVPASSFKPSLILKTPVSWSNYINHMKPTIIIESPTQVRKLDQRGFSAAYLKIALECKMIQMHSCTRPEVNLRWGILALL